MTSDTKSNDGPGIDSDTIPLDPCTDINPSGWPGVKNQRSKKTGETDATHESGLEQAQSEPKQGTGEE